jgi:hypothetical protein
MEREQIQVLWEGMQPTLNEKQRRQYAATLSKAFGHGGATVVHEVTGVAMNTITRGKKELGRQQDCNPGRVREAGGGPKWTEDKYPEIQEHIRRIVEDSTYGNPEKVISWTTESLRSIASKLLDTYGEKVSYVTVGSILEGMGYSKQANQKMLQVGEPHPDRNAQFEHINATAKAFIKAGEPVISVDTKKKELIGNFKNPGQEYRRAKDPRRVLDHDFPIKELGKIAPYGRLLPERQHRLCQCRHKPRYRRFRCRKHIALVVFRWATHLPPGHKAADHLRLRRQQRLPNPPLEILPVTAGAAHRPGHLRLPPAARHIEMEQNRTQIVLLYQQKLAGQTPC